jgi:hypothetical protein
MAPKKQASAKGRQGDTATRRTLVLVALIAAVPSLICCLLTYFLTDRVRNDLSAQKIQIDQIRLKIEKERSQTDEVRLTPDFAKLSNDLRPNIEIACQGDTSESGVIRMTCLFTNRGANRARITPTSIKMLSSSDQKEIDGAISRIDNTEGNTILPSGKGSNIYEIILTPYGTTIKRPIICIEFQAVTDQVAVAMTKRLAKGLIKDDELRSFAQQSYTFNVRF